MSPVHASPQAAVRTRRIAGLAATLLLHLALLFAWKASHQTTAELDDSKQVRLAWINVPLPRKSVPPEQAKPKPVPQPHINSATRPAAPEREIRAAPAASATPELVNPTTAPAAPAAPRAADIMRGAMRDLGGIDKELKKEFPGPLIKAPRNTPLSRMEQGMEHAAEMAPPKWYEAPKVTEIIDPGGYGRRRYRVITANGTYCVTYESNHAPDGLDTMKNGIKPKITNCPPEEQPATIQK
ncbi:MAG: hypothetical protein ACJ8GW_07285 [Massilia sp.]